MRCINPLVLPTLLMTAANPALAQKGEPPITPLTMRSGGEIDPERAALRLERVDLSLDVDPARKYLRGRAELRLTTSIRQTRLLIDLDRNLGVSAIEIDGATLSSGTWRLA